MKLRTKVWLLTSVIVLAIMAVDVLFGWRALEQSIRLELESQAKDVRGMLMATRRVYHQQFLSSGLPVNDQTVGFLPAHALSRISRDFPNWSKSGMSFNNVSDRPRNPANMADKDELVAMAWFRDHPKETERLTEILGSDGKPYYHYSAPIWIEQYCLTCHGDRERAPVSISQNYDSAYGYKLGDLRGVMSIKLPAGPVREREYGAWGQRFAFRFAGYVALLLALGVFLNRVVVTRVARLESAAGRLAQGDYSVRLENDAQDELGSLTRAFNHMAQSVQDHQTALAKSELHFRTATESMRDAFVLIEGGRGLVRAWNRAAEAMFGWRQDEVLGRPLHDILLPEKTACSMASALRAFSATGEGAVVGKTLELSAWHKDGHSFPVELSVSAMPEEGNWLAVGVVRDITERKAIEAGRERQLASLKALNEIGAIPDLPLEDRLRQALAVVGRLFNLDFSFVVELSGRSNRVLARHSVAEVLSEDLIGPMSESLGGMVGRLETVLAIADLSESAYRDSACRRLFQVEAFLGAPVIVGGAHYGIVGFGSCQPYTRHFDEADREFMGLLARWVGGAIERNRARQMLEAEVQQRTSELSSLFLAIPDMYFRMGRDGTILEYRSGRQADLYVTPEQFLGRRMQEVLPEPVAAKVRAAISGLDEAGSVAIEYTLSLAAGEQSFEARFLPLGKEQMVAVVRNITGRRAMELARESALAEAERLARLRSEFLANMSHEIRTPLNGVLGMAQIGLRNTDSGTKAREVFGCIVDSGKVLMGVVNDILDFSRIEAGKLAVECLPVDIRRLVHDAIALVADKVKSKGLVLEVQEEADLAVCTGDPVRLAQVLGNLLSNAVKFTHQGRVTVSIGRDGGQYVLGVRDTGIGMSEEQVGRLFKPFEQADGSMTRRFGGTGLGLAICLRLVELMGGRIDVHSTPGIGSYFEVRLPYMPVSAGVAGTESPGLALPAQDLRLKGYRLLVAEDNPVNQMVIREMLEEEGAEVMMADDGGAALEHFLAAKADHFDLVFMDVQMPVMDGLKATRAILAVDPAARVVGQTAHAMADERSKCLEAGMVDVIVKPLAVDDLVSVVLRNTPKPRSGDWVI